MKLSSCCAPLAMIVPVLCLAQSIVPPKAPLQVGTLQANDEIVLRSLQIKEIAEKNFRLDGQGDVNLPMLGRVRLGDLSPSDAESLLNDKFRVYYTNPDIELTVTSVHAEVVSVIGAVTNPGFHDIKPRTTLLDALSSAGGLRGDAGPTAILTRQPEYGAIPRADAHFTMVGESVVTLDVKGLVDGSNPDENILIKPRDVISIPLAQMVYVVGNVRHAGGFTLSGASGMTVLQALSRAEGLDPKAQPEKARILRKKGSQAELQIPVDLKRVFAGKSEDLAMQPNDILFVPASTAKIITSRTIDAAVQVAIGLAIFSRF
jgi:polysaccharide biosynthesis/export protein